MSLNKSVLTVLAFLLVIIMMIIPVPAIALDLGLAASFAIAVLIFSMALFVKDTLDFSSFPTFLLLSLVLRLSLNVSSTKLIIGEGHTGVNAAGDVISGFAKFVMRDSVILGLIVFGVLLIVNFLVITKGAARMAEVSARFALDGMPGKQLAIDSDMSAGAIDYNQAKQRREKEQAEMDFFGSLDGASKFVRGDAVAGLLITFLNLVAGLAVGFFLHGLPFEDAFRTYAILTVGDGLVSQLPAVIVSIAAALLLSRGGASGAPDELLLSQVGKYPLALYSVSFVLLILALFPGLPFVPFMLGSVGLTAFAYFSSSALKAEDSETADIESSLDSLPAQETVADILELDEFHVEFAPNLVPLALDVGTGLETRIASMRAHVARSFGVILPEVRLTDDSNLADGTYVIRIQGVEVARAILLPDKVLAIAPSDTESLPNGVEAIEPVYGASARWIDREKHEPTVLNGVTVVTPMEVLATHMLEVTKTCLSRLLTVKSLRRLLEELVQVSDEGRAAANRKMLDDFIPDKVPLDLLHAVLRLLLEEQVSIRNIPLILEAIAEARVTKSNPGAICEHVRQRLRFQLVSDVMRDDGTVPFIQLAPEWEGVFETYQMENEGDLDIALPPNLFSQLGGNISTEFQKSEQSSSTTALVTSARRRRYLKTLLRAQGLNNPVLSYDEVGVESKPALLGVVPL